MTEAINISNTYFLTYGDNSDVKQGTGSDSQRNAKEDQCKRRYTLCGHRRGWGHNTATNRDTCKERSCQVAREAQAWDLRNEWRGCLRCYPPGAVLDTNILVSAALWPKGVAGRLLDYLCCNEVCLYTSEEILSEMDRVLDEYFNLGSDERKYISMSYRKHHTVLVVPKIIVVEEDSDDDKIASVAIATQSIVVSFDKHLLRNHIVQAFHPLELL